MNLQFDNFNNNINLLLEQTNFQPSRFVNKKYGKKYTRRDYNNDKTMGCRGTAFYLFATLTNNKHLLNEEIPNREELDYYIEKYDLISSSTTINTEIIIPNKSIAIVSLFANVFGKYYVPWHTFLLIRFDNETGHNFKILQSWNDKKIFISIYELSTDWIHNPSDYILSIIKRKNIYSWKKLFGNKTIENIIEDDKIKYKFNFQILNNNINESWF